MTFAYKDFTPTADRGVFSSTFETLPATLERANQWLAESGVDVMNVETVILPNIFDEDSSSKGAVLATGVGINSYWVQVVRVWYHAEPPRG